MSNLDKRETAGKQDSGRRGLTLVYTGEGKGKTTAALGLALRAAGRGMKVLILQFIKSPERTYGEKIALERLGVEICQLGIGFTWTKTPEEHREALARAWKISKERVMSGDYDLVILDEINNALAIKSFPIDDVLPMAEVLNLIQNRPPHLHLVLTGRNAHEKVMEAADLVSRVEAVKHYYHEGIPAVRGIEF
ncbi:MULTISPECIES: cob(I)yrinic acid a,c-diamide adenosyltransferase [Thermoactinomyces]|jgi:cob(I)alamin adenosyltransferase|uniref:Cob(I)yrinic acid a,c-diamide adenosyltransferase n=1 Tax=Thermoactinomyces daqus TaxID=1329516 RepID=A0A7W2AIU4_9BACL|nr:MULTISPECIES: cob(I)yrinic acid a,c-diamide adenosyltransferase [Thermoactinomyces]MBA4544111.1 cob(I)yrinic acid a,c-diamide adenosyltransferase [Thermoactinomyces daqus]MBH8599348.1 cob(I)yrinic acid a,c-diamide adenosyltransferase [Thermoactinomyces sp. CICC 10523]MBH8605296.1 cob(I)yrinic acid a,c-diamide adenosyltransferase [Thermoactinomyces sp. CICC 10522]MBH8608207.1 cob(I)yrinic acid a,c-diamide adenosyltransferase [Thermoactinomyces sp. CICC 10521]